MSAGLARMLLVALWTPVLIVLTISTVVAANPAEEKLAEGKYKYISTSQDSTVLTNRWSEFGQAMPKWKDKARIAHYSFKEGVIGRKCDQRDCHPGFTDNFVQKLTALPEGEKRIQGREIRYGLPRCDDCHSYNDIKDKTNACRLHFQLRDLVQCSSCHATGDKRVIPLGEKKTVALLDRDERLDWPGHKLTKDEKQISCDKNCHIKDNPFNIKSDCAGCHGKGKLELASYISPNVLVHSTARGNIIPDLIRALYRILIAVTVIYCLFYIVMDIFRFRNKGDS